MRKIVLCIVLFALLLASGCGVQSRAKTSDFNKLYEQGKYEEAQKVAADGGENAAEASDPLLWNLHAGACCIAVERFDTAISIFDQAEDLCKEDDLESGALKGAQAAGEILTNRYIVDYDPTQYDKTFVNYYKALSFMALGDDDNSRVEWNRVYDRQRRAVEEFEREISKTKEELQEEAAENASNEADSNEPKLDVDRMVETAKEKMGESDRDYHEWKPYTDFVNPYPTYMGGIYWLAKGEDKGDFEKALDNLKRVKGMTDCAVLDQDLKTADACMNGAGSSAAAKNVWIVFENGMGPMLEEVRLDLPVFAVSMSSPVKTLSMALPRMKFRNKAYDYLDIETTDAKARTVQLASIDRVVATEFDVYYDSILAKSIASTAAKALSQYLAQETLGDTASLVVGIFNTLTTQADTRMWTALPKEVQVARVALPTDGRLLLKSPQGAILSEVAIPDCDECIVYVRIPKVNIPPAVATIPL